MLLRGSVILYLILITSLINAQITKIGSTNLVTSKEINATGSTLSGKIKKKPSDKTDQYLDRQTIIGYTFSTDRNSVMNQHPEIGIGLGFKKYNFTTGITGTVRFLKARKPYTYYYNNDTFDTRYFTDLAFAFYFHKAIFKTGNKELFFEIAPGFEVLYLERTGASYNRSRASTISFHATAGPGFRITRPNLRYYQLATFINYNNFSYGKSTNIIPQAYFNIRFAFGVISIDEWASNKNSKKQ